MATQMEKLAELRAKKEAKLEAKAKQREAVEIEILELEERLESELGERGKAFEIVDCSSHGEGIIAVKLGPSILHKAFMNHLAKVSEEKCAPHEAMVDAYVTPCLVQPSVDVYRAIVARRPVIADRVSNALATLFGVRLENERKKF